jgi:hypothetical protein
LRAIHRHQQELFMPACAFVCLTAASFLLAASHLALAESTTCAATSAATVAPVVELFTSEGCSSCPPADRWASTLKGSGAVVQAFHVGYWDYIGWVDRFATPAHTTRQREVAARNNLRSIYTPQAVLNGKDWPDWHAARSPLAKRDPARVNIALERLGPDQFEARVTPLAEASGMPLAWSAYWSITEHGHQSKVQAGENSGELLKHDFVVRQYTQAGDYTTTAGGSQKLTFRSIAPTPGHERQVNLIVYDRKTGATLQALSLQCSA